MAVAASMVSTRYMNNEEMFTTEAKTITFPLLSKSPLTDATPNNES